MIKNSHSLKNSRYYLTSAGYEMLLKYKHQLQEQCKKAVALLQEAKAHGDLRENAEYKAAEQEISRIQQEQSRINQISNISQIIVKPIDVSIIRFGNRVKLQNLTTNNIHDFILAGQFESEQDHKSFINYESPFGQSLLFKAVNEYIHYDSTTYQVIEIS